MGWLLFRQYTMALFIAFALNQSCELEIFGMFVSVFLHFVFMLVSRPFADQV